MSERQTDREILQEVWTKARRIAREYVASGPTRDPETTLQLLIKTIVNDRTNAAIERLQRRSNFEVVAEPRTVWIYDNGETEKFFETEAAAKAWCVVHDPDGMAYMYEYGPVVPDGQADRYGVPKAKE